MTSADVAPGTGMTYADVAPGTGVMSGVGVALGAGVATDAPPRLESADSAVTALTVASYQDRMTAGSVSARPRISATTATASGPARPRRSSAWPSARIRATRRTAVATANDSSTALASAPRNAWVNGSRWRRCAAPSSESIDGPTTRAVENRGSSTVNVSLSRITRDARSCRVTSQPPRAGSQETGSCSRSRRSSGCGSPSSSATVAAAPNGNRPRSPPPPAPAPALAPVPFPAVAASSSAPAAASARDPAPMPAPAAGSILPGARREGLPSGTAAAQDPGGREIAVVDDDVRQGPRADLGQVDQLGGVVAVAMQPGRRGGAFRGRVARDAAAQGQRGIHVEPDPVVPEVVVLRAEREYRVDDQHRAIRGTDHLVPVVLASQRVAPAEHDRTGPAGACRAEQQVPGRAEVVGVAVVALAADPVVAKLAGLPPRVLEVVKRGAQGGAAQDPQRGGELMPEACLARRGHAVDRDAVPARAQQRYLAGHIIDEFRPGSRGRRRDRLPPGGDRLKSLHLPTI